MDKKLTKEKIIEAIENHRNEINKFGVKKLGLFGSFSKNEQEKGSDLDFLVEFEKASFDKYMKLLFLLEDIFERKVDLVIENNLRKELNYVKREAKYVRL